jgi:hypothetical protein
MRDELTQQIAEIFAEAKVLPREIWIQQQREYLNRALTPLTEELGIKVIETPSLKTLNPVKEALLMMLTNPNAVDDGDFTSLNEDI